MMSPSDEILSRQHVLVEDDRTGTSHETLRRAVLDNLFYIQGKFPGIATPNDYYMALAYTVRDRLLHRWVKTVETWLQEDVKIVCYLSAEFLMGPHLGNNLLNLGIEDPVRQAVAATGQNLDELLKQEEEPGLGNGGLGRLAACYLDSLATLEVPAIGFGLRYEHGIFHQAIRDGWQVEMTDNWLHLGNPWEIPRPENHFEVKLGGHTERIRDADGKEQVCWIPDRVVKGTPFDTPISGYRVNTCNTLRLWKAEAAESFDFQAFNTGDYYGAVDEKVASENLTKVLYPNDEPIAGKQLRLEQQYFMVSCSLQNIIDIHRQAGGQLEYLHKLWAVQLNDTHPAVAVAELMRLLVDEHRVEWDQAWHVTVETCGYTNHTLLPEALEKWPLPLFARVLPRHLEIIYEINQRFLESVERRFPGDNDRLARMSLIDENGLKSVRMANLACVGSHAINGVAALHTELVKKDVLRDFYEMMPEKFSNKTNGVTPRRFVALSNPGLSRLITRHIGDGWIKNLDELRGLEAFAEQQDFQSEWQSIKRENKLRLAELVRERTGIETDPDSLFDILVKRIHEYKRQHLSVLHIITLYNQIKENPAADVTPRTFIFGGKAAPGYHLAKLIIKLINGVAEVVNTDADVGGRLKVVFLPDFDLKSGQLIYPAADLSEQISMAGKEASGTGNMKFSMNGALTIGTLDGANIEIREEVGADNFFLFGLTVEQVKERKAGGYNPGEYYDSDKTLRRAMDQIRSGVFSRGDTQMFEPLVRALLQWDEYLVLADYRSYIKCQDQASQLYRDQNLWTRAAILNVARMGKFSSDRSIRQYCEDIWHARPVPIELAPLEI
ncbi:MAG: glycogen/starch/alpha-glucan phosphorylase [Desulfobacteraceae bacterium]|jgi:starch phosphorylase|nr:glycogen/starch/alpha-glucan phosphorylase [Desulfobacteraceae bacterium]